MSSYEKKRWRAGELRPDERQDQKPGAAIKRGKIKLMTFSSDELILALVSLVRVTRPAMLRQEADGFSVDFEAIARGGNPGRADRLLLKMGAVMNSETPYPAKNPHSRVSLDLDASEARQIADALAKLELVQAWPQDVMEMSRALRARLVPDPPTGSLAND